MRNSFFTGIKYTIQNREATVIACGGCGSIEDLKTVLYTTNVNAAAIGSMAVYSKKGMGVLINFPKRESIIQE